MPATKTKTSKSNDPQEKRQVDPALLEKMKRSIEQQGYSLADVAQAFGLGLVAQGSTGRADTRIARKEKYLEPRPLEGDDKKVVSSLVKVIGTAIAPDDPSHIPTPEEIDLWVGELLPVRQAQDILGGDHERIRRMALNAITAKNGGDSEARGQLVSLEHQTKLVKSVSESQDAVDYSKLEGLVDHETWIKATDQVRFPNEQKIAKLFAEGEITYETLLAITYRTKPRVSFLVQPYKEGDPI